MRQLSPEEIKRIREKLDLNQYTAGTVIGGGEKAWTKYEREHPEDALSKDKISPSSGLNNLLHLLDRLPQLLGFLQDGETGLALLKPKAGDEPLYPSKEAAMTAPGAVYVHKDGGIYRLVGEFMWAGEDIHDGDAANLYEHLWPDKHGYYGRPISEFIGIVEKGGRTVRRFKMADKGHG